MLAGYNIFTSCLAFSPLIMAGIPASSRSSEYRSRLLVGNRRVSATRSADRAIHVINLELGGGHVGLEGKLPIITK